MKKYKLFIRIYDLHTDSYVTEVRLVETNDIYHEIGYIFCVSLEQIKRIDYLEVTND